MNLIPLRLVVVVAFLLFCLMAIGSIARPDTVRSPQEAYKEMYGPGPTEPRR